MSLSGRIERATRLTRLGKLDEAVAVLKGQAGGAPAPSLDLTALAARAKAAFQSVKDKPVGTEGGLRKREAVLRGVAGGSSALGSAAVETGKRAGSVSGGASFEARTFASEQGHLDYKLYTPSRAAAGQALPLVVMLHGCTQSPDDFALGTRMNELAEAEGVYVAYPAQSQSANASKCWNWFRAGDQQRGRGEPALIAGMVRQIMRDAVIDPDRVYVAGLSAGGAAAAVLGQTYPELFAAVGVHSGLACGAATSMSSAFSAMKGGGSAVRTSKGLMPTIVFHGDQDGTVSPVNGAQVIAQAEGPAHLRTSVDRGRSPGGVTYTRTVQSDAAGLPTLEHWVLHGAGHAWSGGSTAGSYTDPRGPDASAAMLRFFGRHARKTPA